MIEVTQLQRDNLAIAKARWSTIPQRNVSTDLMTWRYRTLIDSHNKPPTCDTIACFGGWCAWIPEFMEQGVKARTNGSPYLEGSSRESSEDVSEALFGDRYMFSFRGDYKIDDDREYNSDWQIVMNRIDYLRYSSEVVQDVTL